MRNIKQYETTDFAKFEELGRGTYATVFRVGLTECLKLDNSFAMKLSKPSSKSCLNHVENEMEILQDLKHENIISIFGFLCVYSQVGLILEWVDGTTLRQELAIRYGKFEMDYAQGIFSQLVSGVNYLHSQNVAHADINPENIMISYEGIAKLIDFGRGMKLGVVRSHADTSNEEKVEANPYIAPELVSYPSKTVEDCFYGDVWSLGVILFETLTGKIFDYRKSSMTSQLEENQLTNGEVICVLKACLKIDKFDRSEMGGLSKFPWLMDKSKVVELCAIELEESRTVEVAHEVVHQEEPSVVQGKKKRKMQSCFRKRKNSGRSHSLESTDDSLPGAENRRKKNTCSCHFKSITLSRMSMSCFPASLRRRPQVNITTQADDEVDDDLNENEKMPENYGKAIDIYEGRNFDDLAVRNPNIRNFATPESRIELKRKVENILRKSKFPVFDVTNKEQFLAFYENICNKENGGCQGSREASEVPAVNEGTSSSSSL